MSTTVAPADHTMATYARWPVTLVRGEAATAWDDEGRRFLDMTSGIAVNALGHAHPAVVEAVRDQAARLIHVSNLYSNVPQRELAARLSEITRGKLAFFCNSGSEAIESAIKLARKVARERGRGGRVIAAAGGFHGRTLGALSATGQPPKKEAFQPLLEGFEHVPFGDASALAARLDGDVAAVLLEPIQGEAGVVLPPEGYLRAVRQLCDDAGALLILDEIQTGLGRTGSWFGYEGFGLSHGDVDVVCLAKALAGGLPLGACLATPEVADVFVPGDHGSTFGGGPVQCAAALAVLEVISCQRLLERARRLGQYLIGALQERVRERGSVRGRGLLVGVEFDAPVAGAIAETCLARGVLVNHATPTVLRFMPPLIVTQEEIDSAAHVLEEAIDEVTAA